MKRIKEFFHYISMLQYPAILIGLFFANRHYWYGKDNIWEDYNLAMIFIGIAISFGSLADYKRKKNRWSKKIWSNPRFANIFIFYLSVITFIIFSFGFYAMFFVEDERIRTFSTGSFVLGVGIIGMIKSSIDTAAYEQSLVNMKELDLYQEL